MSHGAWQILGARFDTNRTCVKIGPRKGTRAETMRGFHRMKRQEKHVCTDLAHVDPLVVGIQETKWIMT